MTCCNYRRIFNAFVRYTQFICMIMYFSNGKYIPPSKRQSQHGVTAAHSGHHTQTSFNGSTPQASSGGITKKPIYGSAVHGNFTPVASGSGSAYHMERRYHD